MPEQQLEEVREERLAGDKNRRIPVASTTLVGREVELVTLAGRVLDPSARLVTLTGPGGVGKSRLAAAVAHRVGGRFRSGVGFVDVATCDLAEVCGQVRRILAVGGQDRTGEGQAQHWLGDEMLLVLDGCERLVAARRQRHDGDAERTFFDERARTTPVFGHERLIDRLLV